MLVCHGRSVLRGSPHEDVEHVVGSSGAPQDREREPRSSFAAAALSLEAAASRASSEGVASPKTVVKDERIAIKYAAATRTRTRRCEANFKGPPGF